MFKCALGINLLNLLLLLLQQQEEQEQYRTSTFVPTAVDRPTDTAAHW